MVMEDDDDIRIPKHSLIESPVYIHELLYPITTPNDIQAANITKTHIEMYIRTRQMCTSDRAILAGNAKSYTPPADCRSNAL